MSQACEVQARFFWPPPQLRRYFTTFYYVEVCCDRPFAQFDYLHPEWANFRIIDGCKPVATNFRGDRAANTNFYVTGPSCKAVRFEFDGPIRMWGIGVLPLGWTKFVGLDAGAWADALVDGNDESEFAEFVPLAAQVYGEQPDLDGELARITQFFLDRVQRPVPDEDRVLAIHAALVDPEVDSVAELVDRAGVSNRTVERICHRAFGFPPKLLLRRQRFLRSLAKYVLDPSLKWIGALDSQYHDQAQFVKDFKQFMGMSPRQYAALDKPILNAVMHARAQFAGKAVQGLDSPARGT
ncbi:MAG: helix-turn-helix domain-containing protein [Novosphingobium sp.]